MEEPADDDDDDAAGFAFASAHDQKQEIRVNLLYVYLLGWQKKRVTQFISSSITQKFSGQTEKKNKRLEQQTRLACYLHVADAASRMPNAECRLMHAAYWNELN